MKAIANQEWQPQPWKVLSVKKENGDTMTLEVAPMDSSNPFQMNPGQFNMLYGFGIGEVPISVSGFTDRGILHTVRAVGAVSQYLANLEVGQTLGLRGPYGNSWDARAGIGKDLLIVAGGVGLAPLRPFIRDVIEHKQHYRNINLLYGGRQEDQLLFLEELKDWEKSIRVLQTVDHATDSWTHHVGVVTEIIPRATFEPSQTLAYLCGPEIMMRYAGEMLLDQGLNLDSIFLSMERNMKCAIGLCGHCQWGRHFICKDGPIYQYRSIRPLLNRREL